MCLNLGPLGLIFRTKMNKDRTYLIRACNLIRRKRQVHNEQKAEFDSYAGRNQSKNNIGVAKEISLEGEMMFPLKETGKTLVMDFEGHEVTMQNILGCGITRDKCPEEEKQT